MPSRGRRSYDLFEDAGLLGAAIMRHPREFVGVVTAAAAVMMIFINALFLQKGPHPAPIFATRSSAPLTKKEAALPPHRPVGGAPVEVTASARNQAQITSDIQRELGRRGYYDGAVDGIWGTKTAAAARDFVQAARLTINPEASESLLHAVMAAPAKTASPQAALPRPAPDAPRDDKMAKPITTSKRIIAVQRALADFGYGQIKPTGLYDQDTRAAIEKFQHDRNLQVDGQLSDRFVHELAVMTGRKLDE